MHTAGPPAQEGAPPSDPNSNSPPTLWRNPAGAHADASFSLNSEDSGILLSLLSLNLIFFCCFLRFLISVRHRIIILIFLLIWRSVVQNHEFSEFRLRWQKISLCAKGMHARWKKRPKEWCAVASYLVCLQGKGKEGGDLQVNPGKRGSAMYFHSYCQFEVFES